MKTHMLQTDTTIVIRSEVDAQIYPTNTLCFTDSTQLLFSGIGSMPPFDTYPAEEQKHNKISN